MRVCSKCGTPDNATGICSNCKSSSFREIGKQPNSTYPNGANYQYLQNNCNASAVGPYQHNCYNGGFPTNNSNQYNGDYDNIYGLPSNMSELQKITIIQTLNSANTMGTLALILGILLSGGFIGIVLAIIFGAIGISKANSLPMMPPNTPFEAKKSSAKLKCILGMVFSFVLGSVVWLLLGLFGAGLLETIF